MSINFKIATLAVGVASLFGAGQASAAGCDGSIQQTRNGRTIQCYYLPTMSDGHYIGLQKQVNYGGTFNSPYGGQHSGGATIGNYPRVERRPK
jgi:hypothetical protein